MSEDISKGTEIIKFWSLKIKLKINIHKMGQKADLSWYKNQYLKVGQSIKIIQSEEHKGKKNLIIIKRASNTCESPLTIREYV